MRSRKHLHSQYVILTTFMAVAFLFLSNVAVTSAQPKSEKRDDVAQKIKPYAGRFVGETFKLISRRSGDGVRGELIEGDQIFDFVGTVVDGKLKGSFKVGDLESQFVGTIKDGYLTLLMGTRAVKLKRFADSPLVNKVRLGVSLLVESATRIDESIVLSKDQSIVAFIQTDTGKQRVSVNGQLGPPRFRAKNIAISQSGGQVAYYIQESAKTWQAVVADKVGPKFDSMVNSHVTFSRDGKRFAYIGVRDDKHIVVIDGEESQPYELAASLVFSEDGKRVGFIALKGGRWKAVIDGREEADYQAVGRFIFSPDGKRYIYPTLEGTTQRLVVDGKAGKTMEAIPWYGFTPDSKRVAHSVVDNFRSRVVFDNSVGALYDQTTLFRFSPDSKRFAYAAAQNGQYVVVVDGKAGVPFKDVGRPVFSPDGKSIAFQGVSKNQARVYVNGEKGEPCEAIFDIAFSPNSKRLAYVGRRGQNWFVVADGKKTKLFDTVLGSRLLFSPDSDHVIFGATRDAKHFVVVDGIPTELPGRFLPSSRIVFDSPSQFHTVIKRGDRFERVDAKILK